MPSRAFLILVLICGFSCKNQQQEAKDKEATVEVFNKQKWAIKKGEDYPYRNNMVDDILYNDTIRSLNREEIISLLGVPDRENEGHLYYMIRQRRLGSWPLHTKTLVIKFSGDSSIAWIKLHE